MSAISLSFTKELLPTGDKRSLLAADGLFVFVFGAVHEKSRQNNGSDALN